MSSNVSVVSCLSASVYQLPNQEPLPKPKPVVDKYTTSGPSNATIPAGWTMIPMQGARPAATVLRSIALTYKSEEHPHRAPSGLEAAINRAQKMKHGEQILEIALVFAARSYHSNFKDRIEETDGYREFAVTTPPSNFEPMPLKTMPYPTRPAVVYCEENTNYDERKGVSLRVTSPINPVFIGAQQVIEALCNIPEHRLAFLAYDALILAPPVFSGDPFAELLKHLNAYPAQHLDGFIPWALPYLRRSDLSIECSLRIIVALLQIAPLQREAFAKALDQQLEKEPISCNWQVLPRTVESMVAKFLAESCNEPNTAAFCEC